jgi:hypothetical protein
MRHIKHKVGRTKLQTALEGGWEQRRRLDNML